MSFSWTCPFCNRPTTITEHDTTYSQHNLFKKYNYNAGDFGYAVTSAAIKCPNPDCNKTQITVALNKHKLNNYNDYSKDFITEKKWFLIPDSTCSMLPDYIPTPIKQDYEEACKIKLLSPKASATLSRRCLQGMIRDFWGVNKNNLHSEINALQDKLPLDIWNAIDAIRKIGNIGAHMEKDINTIIDIEPEEAQHLINLIELLIEEWYIARHDREQRINKVIQLKNKKN